MSDFDRLLHDYTTKGKAKVHGVFVKCVDKEGSVIYSKIAGYDSVRPDAAPLKDDAVFKFASATKLITSVALLQCIDDGLVGIDQPLDKLLPELGRQVIKGVSDNGDLILEPAINKITPRHLLTHTSGLAYWFLNPLLMKWKQTPDGKKYAESTDIHERCNIPLVFEPGSGWSYGVGLDWAGVLIKRLHGGMSLEDYMIEHVWKTVGRSAPFPTFCISKSPGHESHLMAGAERDVDGELRPYEFWQGDNPHDQDGGHGLSGTADDWLAVLADLLSDHPRLLRPETIAMMFEPQLASGAPSIPMLLQLRPAWELVTGKISDQAVNHGLGGILVTEPLSKTGQPRNILGWGGAANTVWFIAREHGVAGFFSTQLHPFADSYVAELVDAWKSDFWSGRS